MGKDVSRIVEQRCEMTFLKRLSRYRPCIVSKIHSLFSLFLPIVITFSNSFYTFILCTVLVLLYGVHLANQLRLKGHLP